MADRSETFISKVIIDGSAAEAGTQRVSTSLNVMQNALSRTLGSMDPLVKATMQMGRELTTLAGQTSTYLAAQKDLVAQTQSGATALKMLNDRQSVLVEMQRRLETGTLSLAQAQGALSGKLKSVADFVNTGRLAYLEFMAQIDKTAAAELAQVKAIDLQTGKLNELRDILKGTTLGLEEQEAAIKKVSAAYDPANIALEKTKERMAQLSLELVEYKKELGLVDAAELKFREGKDRLQSVITELGVSFTEGTKLLAAYVAKYDPAIQKEKELAASGEALARSRDKLKAAMLAEVGEIAKGEQAKASAYKQALAAIDPLYALELQREKLHRDLRAGAAASSKNDQQLAEDLKKVDDELDRHKQVLLESAERQKQLAAAGGMSRNAMLMLNASVINTIQSLSAGLPVTMVLMQQLPQIAGAFAQESTALTKLTTAASGFVTANVGLLAGIGSTTLAFAGGVTASQFYLSSILELSKANSLMGGSTGMLRSGLQGLADAHSGLGRISNQTARDLVAQYTRVGQIGPQVMGRLIEITKDFADLTGTEVLDAGKQLGTLFHDPAKGAEELTTKINLLSSAELAHIQHLADSGQKLAAQTELLNKLKVRTDEAKDSVNGLGAAFASVGKNISNAADKFGEFLTKPFSGDLQDQVDSLKASLAGFDFIDALLPRFISGPILQQRLADAQAKLAAALAKAQKSAIDVAENEASIAAANIAKTLDPLAAQIAKLQGEIDALARANPGKVAPELDLDGAKLAKDQQKAELEYLLNLGKGLDAATVKEQLLAEAKLKAAKAGNTPEAMRQLQLQTAWIQGLGTGTKDPNHSARQGIADTEWIAQQTGAINQQNMALSIQAKMLLAQAGAWKQYVDGFAAYPDAMARVAAADARSRAEQEALSLAINVDSRTRQLLTETALKQQATSEQALASLELELIGQAKITKATKDGVDARRLAIQEQEIYKGQAPILAAAVMAETAGNDALGKSLRQLAKDYRDKNIAAAEGKLEDNLAKVGEEISHQTELLRERQRLVGADVHTKAQVAAQREITEQLYGQGYTYQKLNTEQRKTVDNLVRQKQIYNELDLQVQRQEGAWQELSQIGERAFDRLGDALADVFASGKKEAIDWGNVTKSIISSLITDLLKMAAIRPLQNAMFGTNQPTLWDAFSGGGGNQTITVNGQTFQATGGTSNLLSAGNSLYDIGTGANTLGSMTSNFAMSSYGTALGLSAAGTGSAIGVGGMVSGTGAGVAGAGANAAGVMGLYSSQGVTGLTSTGAGAVSGMSAIGAAAPYGMLGGIGGAYIANNFANGNRVVGGVSGAALGVGSMAAGTAIAGAAGLSSAGAAAGAGMAGAYAGLAAIPVYGWIAAAVLAAVTAVLGSRGKSPTPYGGAWVDTDSTGQVFNRASGSENGVNASDLEKRADAINSVMSGIAQAGGFAYGQINLATEYQGGKGGKGDRTLIGGWGGTQVSTSGDVARIGLDALRYLRDSGKMTGGNALSQRVLAQAIDTGSTDNIENIVKAIGLAQQVSASTTALSEFDKSLQGFADRAKKAQSEALKPMLEELKLATDFNFKPEYLGLVTRQLTDMTQELANPTQYTQTEVAMAEFRGQIAALRETAVQLDPALGAVIDKLGNAGLSRIARDLNKNLDQQIAEVNGRGYINQINSTLENEQMNERQLKAVGEPTTKALELARAQLNQVLTGLTVEQLNVVSASYDTTSELGKLVHSLLDTAMATKKAAEAMDLARASADLYARQWTLKGNSRPGTGMNATIQTVQAILGAAPGTDIQALISTSSAEIIKGVFDQNKADYIEGINREMQARQDEISAIQNTTLKLGQLADQFRSAYNALALNDNAPLSPEERLKEVRAQWDAAVAVVRSSTSSDAEKATAKETLLNLGNTRLDIARTYFASSNDSDYREIRDIYKELGINSEYSVDKAQKQIDLLQKQIDEYTKMRTSAERLGERQLGSLDSLKGSMDSAYQAMVTAISTMKPVDTTGIYNNLVKSVTSKEGLDNVLSFARQTGNFDLAKSTYGRANELGMYWGNYSYADPIGAPLYERADSDYEKAALSFLRTLGYSGGYDINANMFLQTYNKGAEFTDWLRKYANSRWGLQNGGLVGYANGGIIGNGIYGQDSVIAQFAGGGAVALAGGEHVTRADAVNANTYPTLDYINRNGEVPRSAPAATGVVEAQLTQANAQIAQLTRTVEYLCRVIQDGDAKNMQATLSGNAQLTSMAAAAVRQTAKRKVA